MIKVVDLTTLLDVITTEQLVVQKEPSVPIIVHIDQRKVGVNVVIKLRRHINLFIKTYDNYKDDLTVVRIHLVIFDNHDFVRQLMVVHFTDKHQVWFVIVNNQQIKHEVNLIKVPPLI